MDMESDFVESLHGLSIRKHIVSVGRMCVWWKIVEKGLRRRAIYRGIGSCIFRIKRLHVRGRIVVNGSIRKIC